MRVGLVQRWRSSPNDALSGRREWKQPLQRKSTIQDTEHLGGLSLLFAYFIYIILLLSVLPLLLPLLYLVLRTLCLLRKSQFQPRYNS